MSRLEELKGIFKDIEEGKRKIIDNLLVEAVFLEEQMEKLKEYPHIKTHPTNPNLQKVTAAGKMYREYLQTYTNIIDKLCRIYGKEDGEAESPLRDVVKAMKKQFGVEV